MLVFEEGFNGFEVLNCFLYFVFVYDLECLCCYWLIGKFFDSNESCNLKVFDFDKIVLLLLVKLLLWDGMF